MSTVILVLPPGIEPGCLVLQTSAMTTFAKAAKLVCKYFMNLHNDLEFWRNLQWPAAPNYDDVEIYRKHCSGTVLLLGSTRQLLPLCTDAWDLEPKYNHARIQHRDWLTLDQHYDTIIGDAVLCFTPAFTQQLLPVVLNHCDTFITRSFICPNWKTTYAEYFPVVADLAPVPEEISINEVYTFYIWNRKK